MSKTSRGLYQSILRREKSIEAVTLVVSVGENQRITLIGGYVLFGTDSSDWVYVPREELSMYMDSKENEGAYGFTIHVQESDLYSIMSNITFGNMSHEQFIKASEYMFKNTMRINTAGGKAVEIKNKVNNELDKNFEEVLLMNEEPKYNTRVERFKHHN